MHSSLRNGTSTPVWFTTVVWSERFTNMLHKRVWLCLGRMSQLVRVGVDEPNQQSYNLSNVKHMRGLVTQAHHRFVRSGGSSTTLQGEFLVGLLPSVQALCVTHNPGPKERLPGARKPWGHGLRRQTSVYAHVDVRSTFTVWCDPAGVCLWSRAGA